ncbi:hypothetical protein BGX27_008734 [Mortierella sp. AM989]|nr:hypothetical protein BGX27_008734 [Mortierella sp. AM989]
MGYPVQCYGTSSKRIRSITANKAAMDNTVCNSTQLYRGSCRIRKPWTTWVGLSAVLVLTLPAVISAAPTIEQLSSSPYSYPAISNNLQKRAIQYVDPSDPQIEVTFEADNNYYLETIKLNECVNTFSLPLPPLASYRNYSAITFPEATMAVNFYTDDECKEYDFSVQSEVHEFSGAFASVKYAGEYSDVKPGVYDDHELTRTAPPNPNALVNTGTGNAGFVAGVGLIGLIVIAGVIGLGVMVYRKYSGPKRGGDGRAFMTLSTGRDDYDDEAGLTGENGPHSSALMQSRVGVSFDDERYPVEYRDEEHASDDEQVELNVYPQNAPAPTQYRDEPGTQPQNARSSSSS